MSAMTIVHEVAQELADYIILTDAGKLSPFAALSLNFASGLSVMLGAIIVLATTLEHAARRRKAASCLTIDPGPATSASARLPTVRRRGYGPMGQPSRPAARAHRS